MGANEVLRTPVVTLYAKMFERGVGVGSGCCSRRARVGEIATHINGVSDNNLGPHDTIHLDRRQRIVTDGLWFWWRWCSISERGRRLRTEHQSSSDSDTGQNKIDWTLRKNSGRKQDSPFFTEPVAGPAHPLLLTPSGCDPNYYFGTPIAYPQQCGSGKST